MTYLELRELGLAHYGSEWQSPLGRAIGVGARHIRKLAAGEVPISASIEVDIRRAFGAVEGTPIWPIWPHDAWINGEGASDGGAPHEYLVHTRVPRFICRVVGTMDTLEARQGVTYAAGGTLTGVTYATGGAILCEFVWHDPPPGPAALHLLMEAAATRLMQRRRMGT